MQGVGIGRDDLAYPLVLLTRALVLSASPGRTRHRSLLFAAASRVSPRVGVSWPELCRCSERAFTVSSIPNAEAFGTLLTRARILYPSSPFSVLSSACASFARANGGNPRCPEGGPARVDWRGRKGRRRQGHAVKRIQRQTCALRGVFEKATY